MTFTIETNKLNRSQVKQFKMSVDELTVEISNNSEMYDFVRLKKEIYAAYVDLSRSLSWFLNVEKGKV